MCWAGMRRRGGMSLCESSGCAEVGEKCGDESVYL